MATHDLDPDAEHFITDWAKEASPSAVLDWWPIRAEAALADRLSAMPVQITYEHALSHPEMLPGPTGTKS